MTVDGDQAGRQDEPTTDDSGAPAEEVPAPQSAPLLVLRGGIPPVVSTADQLADAVAALTAGSGPLAVDAERASGYRYSARAYLIQLRRAGSGSLLIDPLPFGDVPNTALGPLGAAVADAEWILHAASQDVACLAEVGLRPRQLFDTELAGRLLNYPRVGLAAMVEDLLGYSMRKEHSSVDWSRRPLPESWLRYAALDVEMLVELRDVLARQLEQTGKADWARQEFAVWTQPRPPLRRPDPWRRTSGIHRVRGRRGLAVVREMWLLRDDLARHRDVAPSRVLRDTAIIEAATALPATRAELSRLPGFASRTAQRYVREFGAAVARALALRDAELPSLSSPHEGPPSVRLWAVKFPAAAARLSACREQVHALAAELELPQENLVDPDVVRRLAWEPPADVSEETVAAAMRATGARPWQVQLMAGRLATALVSG